MENNVDLREKYASGRDYYFHIYAKIYNNLDLDSFDSKFMEIYRDGIIVIDEKEYPLEKLRVRHTQNGITHFILSGNNHLDVYTKERFDDNIDFVCPFRDSTMFFNMYKDGIISSVRINLGKDVMEKYSNGWIPDTHVGIPRLMAEREANKIYLKSK